MNVHGLPRIKPARDALAELDQMRSTLTLALDVINGYARRLTAAEAEIDRLNGALAPRPRAFSPLAEIALRVSAETGVSYDLIRGTSRQQPHVFARFIFCAEALLAGFSSTQVGHWLGKDHTTVLSAAAGQERAREYFAANKAMIGEYQS